MRPGLAHERDQARDRLAARLGARDRPELGGADGEDARHSAYFHCKAFRLRHEAKRRKVGRVFLGVLRCAKSPAGGAAAESGSRI